MFNKVRIFSIVLLFVSLVLIVLAVLLPATSLSDYSNSNTKTPSTYNFGIIYLIGVLVEPVTFLSVIFIGGLLVLLKNNIARYVGCAMLFVPAIISILVFISIAKQDYSLTVGAYFYIIGGSLVFLSLFVYIASIIASANEKVVKKDKFEEIKKYKELLDSNIINEKEFTDFKNKILEISVEENK